MDNDVFNFVYLLSGREAVRQIAFQGEKKWIEGVKGAKDKVKEYIDKIFNGDYEKDDDREAHDKDFLQLTKDVCKAINEYDKKPFGIKATFTFGNAQKLINMTVKFFYISSYQRPGFRDKFRWCHCPMDTVMLKKIYKEIKGSKLVYTKSNFTTSWSADKFENGDFPLRYKEFQEAVRKCANEDGCCPIEYDYKNWKIKEIISTFD